ncbi:MAG: hypothetical protein NDI82_04815 [Anaeromyxobacteraceae bacterium]|nr:hypothetical protein [Anaeromyxobacteraceae bacterium]
MVVEPVLHAGMLLALIARESPRKSGVEFVTPDELSLQFAVMSHPAGRRIEPHVHLQTPRSVQFTQEVLILRRGRLRVDFYGDDRAYLESRELGPGDVIVLVRGGHGFEVLEELEMYEVKQGPFLGDGDKIRFPAPAFTPRIPDGSR